MKNITTMQHLTKNNNRVKKHNKNPTNRKYHFIIKNYKTKLNNDTIQDIYRIETFINKLSKIYVFFCSGIEHLGFRDYTEQHQTTQSRLI